MRVLLLLTILSWIMAAEPTPVLQRVREAAAAVPALRLPFIQEKHLAILEKPLMTAGVLEMDRPAACLRWEFTGHALIILRNGELRRWGPGGREEDLGRDPGLKAMMHPLHGLLTGDWSPLLELFQPEDQPDGLTVRFTPRTPDLGRYVSALTMTFSPQSAPIRLLIESPGGDQTEYRFGAPDTAWTPVPSRFTGP